MLDLTQPDSHGDLRTHAGSSTHFSPAAELQVATSLLGLLHSFPSLKPVASGDVSGVALQKGDMKILKYFHCVGNSSSESVIRLRLEARGLRTLIYPY